MPSSDIRAWAERVASGDRRALARALTEIENRGPSARTLLAELYRRGGQTAKVGVTGAPGVGKSTLVNGLAARFSEKGKTVAVLAVDPTSPFTGGAVLGDRVRMAAHDEGSQVYIRSMAARGALGGLAAATEDALTALSAAGFDLVLVETVGVGQAEVDVARLASPTLLVLTPGMGDGVQALKAGVMEIADIFVINKADLPGADRAETEIRAALELRDPSNGEPPAILRVCASTGDGLDLLFDAVDAFAPPHRDAEAYWRERLAADLRDGLVESLNLNDRLRAAAARVAAGAENPYDAVERLLRVEETGVRIDHIGIAVHSIEDALKLWSEALGVPPGKRIRVDREGVEVAMLPYGDSRIELLQPDPGSAVARFLEKRGEGLHHIALRVDDLDSAAAALRAQNVRLINEEPGVGAEGYRYVFLHPKSANGVLLELTADA